MPLAGKPGDFIDVMPEPTKLYIPLVSRRFGFSKLLVEEGQNVHQGHPLAEDPDNYSIPLLAPREGTVRLNEVEGHIVLDDVKKAREESFDPAESIEHITQRPSENEIKRRALVSLGAWQFFEDARDGTLPDPFGEPESIIVSLVDWEPFTARGEIQIIKRLQAFTRGLEQLQSLIEYQPMHLIIPSEWTGPIASKLESMMRGYAWVQMLAVPSRYPFGMPKTMARLLGLVNDKPVWATGVAGVLAVDRALTLSHPSTVRIISLGGPAAPNPRNVKVVAGYPIETLIESSDRSSVRLINGGVMKGKKLDDAQLGIDTECEGITFLPEHKEREFLGFMRPGPKKPSYSKCFLSALRRDKPRPMTTALNGEHRPCVSCYFCAEVCPLDMLPYLYHKLLYSDELEEAERAHPDRCVECGLCTYVCPSKIDLRGDIQECIRRIQEESALEEGII